MKSCFVLFKRVQETVVGVGIDLNTNYPNKFSQGHHFPKPHILQSIPFLYQTSLFLNEALLMILPEGLYLL